MKFIILLSLIFPLALHAQEPNPNELIVDAIECVGNENTSCDLIQKEIYLNTGDKVNEEELQNAKIRLQLKNLFSAVNVYMQKGDVRGHVKVIIDVTEGDPIYTEIEIKSYYYGPFADSPTSVQYAVGHRNLFGLGKVLQGFIATSDLSDKRRTYTGGFNYSDPHLFGHKKLFFNFGFSQTRNPSVRKALSDGGCHGSCYMFGTDSITNYGLTFGYRVFDFSYFTFGSSIEETSSLTLTDINEFQQSTWKFRTDTIGYGWNSENDSYFATTGSKFGLSYGVSKGNDGPYSNDSEKYKLDFKETWSFDTKKSISLGVDFTRSEYKSPYGWPENYSQHLIGNVRYNYQIKNSNTGSVHRARWYIEAQPSSFDNGSSFYKNYINVGTGILLDTKLFGVVKLSLTRLGF